MTLTDLIMDLTETPRVEPEVLSTKMKLLRQLNYIFFGFGYLISKNRENQHPIRFLSDFELSPEEFTLVQTIKTNIEHILQMFNVVYKKYYKEKNADLEQDMHNLNQLFDHICNTLEGDDNTLPTELIIAHHKKISETYDIFQQRASRKYPTTWHNSICSYEDIEWFCTKEFLNVHAGPFSEIFDTPPSRRFHKKFVTVLTYYHTVLYPSSVLGSNLNQEEIDFLTFILVDLNDRYPKLTDIIRKDLWEKIDATLRNRLVELIDRLIPTTQVIKPRIKYDGEVVQEKITEYDYTVVKKYLNCHTSADAADRIFQIKHHILNPHACRIENMLAELSDLFNPCNPIEDRIAVTDLIDVCKKLNSVIKIKRKIEQKFEGDYSLTSQIDCIFDKNIL